jgi:hypothetical protein
LFVGLRQSEPGSVDVDAKQFQVIAAGITGNHGRYECQRSLNTFAIVNLPTVAVLSLWVPRPVSSGRI